MQTRPTISSILALGLFGWCALAARPAAADTCSTDSDCVKGWSCQVSGATGCATPACPPGVPCDPGPCQNEVFKSCQPAACKADSDCAAGMVCFTHTESDCAPSVCSSKDANCPAPVCETKTTSACVPRYLLPCTTAADCGAGFSCAQNEPSCGCSGSSGSSNGSGSADAGSAGPGNADAGAPVPPVPDPVPNCTCTPTEGQSCTALPVTCASAADCAAGWTCEATLTSSDCATTEPGYPATDGGAPTPPPSPEPCTPSVSVKQCLPPYYSLVHNSGSLDSSTVLPGGAAPGKGETGSGSNNSGAQPVAATGNDTGATSSAAGCSVAFGSRAGGAGGLLVALGLLGVLRRRRTLSASR